MVHVCRRPRKHEPTHQESRGSCLVIGFLARGVQPEPIPHHLFNTFTFSRLGEEALHTTSRSERCCSIFEIVIDDNMAKRLCMTKKQQFKATVRVHSVALSVNVAAHAVIAEEKSGH